MSYTKTALEDWITLRYVKHHIRTPQDIDITCIARHYGIYIHRKPMPARYDIFGLIILLIDSQLIRKGYTFQMLCKS